MRVFFVDIEKNIMIYIAKKKSFNTKISGFDI